MNNPVKLFYSYAPSDEPLRRKLETHLAGLRRRGVITEWHQHAIAAGLFVQDEIDAHLGQADIILLLISPDFLASDYLYGQELQRALQRHANQEARVIPILLRPAHIVGTPLVGLAALPANGKPVTRWSNQDEAYTQIVQGISTVVAQLTSTTASPSTTSISSTHKKNTAGKKTSADTSEQGDTMQTQQASGQALGGTTIRKVIQTYYKELGEYEGKAEHELALRSAFQNMLAECARQVGWTLIPEERLPNGARPDGTLRDTYFPRGYWEAKGPKIDLDREIAKKIAAGYPLTNIIFENTVTAKLYQNNSKTPVFVCDLRKNSDLADLLRMFFGYIEPNHAKFETAVQEFKERIPDLAGALLKIIEQSHNENRAFREAFAKFHELCRASLNPNITAQAIDEMLVQHLLTERLFSNIFENTDFRSNNVIAAEIEKVIRHLVGFSRNAFLRPLDRFYVVIEDAAASLTEWSEKQRFLDTVYERFFQGYNIKQADTHGIVYTPQEIVDFMCASVEEVLKREFSLSIANKDVKILDPATGTGNFIINLVNNYIPRSTLEYKYRNDLFCNEITLMPYYIASLNIEHAYMQKMGHYEPFNGVCFVDTLETAEGKQLSLFAPENTARVLREKAVPIMVVIGNPPYNAWQKSENDNSKNRRYPIIEQRIRETYSKSSKATNRNALSDAYVKFFRWATDRLEGRDGIVCLVTNNSFVDQLAFDGMRMHLEKDFTQIYHLDLHGNVRKNPKLSGTTHNVFGIQVGVGITVAVRNSNASKRAIYYYRVPELWRKVEKLAFLTEKKSIEGIEWQELQPDAKHTWITEGLHSEFGDFLAIGAKDAKTSIGQDVTIFKKYSRGVVTGRDDWAYDFHVDNLSSKVKRLIETYNSDVDRWKRRGSSDKSVDDFVTPEETRIKWSLDLKVSLTRGREATYSERCIRYALYRPFTKRYLYFDELLDTAVYLQPSFFPTTNSERENIGICLTGVASEKPFMVLVTNAIADLHLVGAGASGQCFPYYTYSEDGNNRRENITDWALAQFQGRYGEVVTKRDIFAYVYALLHHPQYRERYTENLKRDLPHIPLLKRAQAYAACVRIGQRLLDAHLNYEQAKEYPLRYVEAEPWQGYRVTSKMVLSPDKQSIKINEGLTLVGVPQECFAYRLGNRSALEWVIDQYQVYEDKRSGIKSDPNRLEDPEYIVRLVKQVITVSLETVRLVNELAGEVSQEDWLVPPTLA